MTASAIAVTPEHLVHLAIATMEWSDPVGLLSLLERDDASTTSQGAYERQGAFLGVDVGVGALPAPSAPGLVTPTTTLELEMAAIEAAREASLRAERLAAQAERQAEQQAQERADAEAQQQADAEAQQQADAEAQQQADAEAQRRAEAERRADAAAQRRADAEAERRADAQAKQRADARAKQRAAERAPAPSTGGAWSNSPHVTWYGPGFYGNRTACGQTYTREIIGVAHKTLPCGTMVQFRWSGITATAPVIDRGPYGPAGYIFDFSAAMSCDVMKARGAPKGCFTRENVAWRVVRPSN
ncbi:MAG: septal ring lytic transglycosylase RlpA family protein [Candidatus Limnocylindrales bacterium]